MSFTKFSTHLLNADVREWDKGIWDTGIWDFTSQTAKVIDQYGVLWFYDVDTKSWINLGFLDVYGNVSRDSDGLVYQQLFEVLESIDPDKFNGLKILSNTGASFYYFYSSDKTIKFKYVEQLGAPQLSTEVNHAIISKKFREFRCQGPKGATGDKGRQGIPGTPASAEKTHKTEHVSGQFSIDGTHVNTPIDTGVSFRLYRDSDKIAEFVVDMDNNVEIILVEGYELANGTGEFDVFIEDNKFYASFILDGPLSGNWTYKLRQRGPQGQSGTDGNWFLNVDKTEIDNDNLLNPEAIYSIYKSSDNISYVVSNVNDEVCATGFVFTTSNKFNINSTRFASAKYSNDSCKDISDWLYAQDPLDIPELNMPNWTPTECCPNYRYWPHNNLDWQDKNKDQPWYQCDPDYDIFIDPRYPEQCCQDEFFFCPDVGDTPCEVTGTPDVGLPIFPGGPSNSSTSSSTSTTSVSISSS